MIPASHVALFSSIQVNDRVNVASLGAEWVEHDEVATEAPRSGLSRSDFVPWPITLFSSFSAFPLLVDPDIGIEPVG